MLAIAAGMPYQKSGKKNIRALPCPPVNLTQGAANLAQLTMKAQFYKQDALTRPNLTQCETNLAQIYVTLQ